MIQLNRVQLKKLFYVIYISVLVISCKSYQESHSKDIEITVIEDTIVNPYIYFNEIKCSNNKLLTNLQSISENEMYFSSPEERLQLKKESLKACLLKKNDCNIIPDSYRILSKTSDVLNIEYSYSQIANKDIFKKLRCFDLKTGNILKPEILFTDLPNVLNFVNNEYKSQWNNYLKNLDPKVEDEMDEIEIIKEHLIQKQFDEVDLLNIELLYDLSSGKLNSLRIHYNGLGGQYSRIIPDGHIEIKRAVLQTYVNGNWINQ